MTLRRHSRTGAARERAFRKLSHEILDEHPYWTCFHCGKLFPRVEICLDHWPYSRGARPDLLLDRRNLKPSCKACNTSGNPQRKAPESEDLSLF